MITMPGRPGHVRSYPPGHAGSYADTRYVTGTTTVVDAGAMHPFKVPHQP